MMDGNEKLKLLMKVNRHRLSNEYREAIDLLLEKINNVGICVEFYEILGEMFFSVALLSTNEDGENYQRAVYWLSKAIELEPYNSRLHLKLGDVLYIGLLDYPSAEKHYQKAIELNPKNKKAYIGIASLYGSPDSNIELGEAIRALKVAREVDPDDPIVIARLGDLLYEDGKVDLAVNAWLEALVCTHPLEEGYCLQIETRIQKH